ncbi:MAG: hypothetical protein GXP41_04325 [Chloroflexi bacterium]|nr:hypothetical protein [Chloroflexota bacterium]
MKHLRLALLLILIISLAGIFAGCAGKSAPPPADRQLSLFIEPQAGKEPVLEAMNGAKKTLRVVVYQITDPAFIQAMKGAVGRGVDVRLILELNPYGGSSGNADVGVDLQSAGVKLKWDPRTINYLHEKAIVVDDEYVVLTTGNLTASAYSANREYGLIIHDPAVVQEVVRVFQADWERTRPQVSHPDLAWAPLNARPFLLKLIDGAQESIDMEQQNMQDAEIEDHLIQAIRRGVRVRLISSPHYPIESDNDEPGREKLRQAGGQVRYLQDPYVHAKVFIIDGRQGFVGSENLTTNSLDFNRELGMRFDDSVAVGQMRDQFAADWDTGTIEAYPKGSQAVPASGYVDHKDAKKFLYREVPVQLTVKELYNSGRVIWLMPDADRDNNFKVVIFPSVWGKWPQTPDVYYQGKTIRVTGLIKLYRGWPEVIVNDPSQVQIVP